jgi:hypothetical protein
MRKSIIMSAAAAAVALAAVPASASCVPGAPVPQRIAQANVAFVGTVLRTSDGGRTAVVSVEQVWKGSVASDVEVRGAVESGAVTSVDRTYEKGTRYLFIPLGERAPFRDNSCSGTTAYTADLDRYRPAGAHAPTAPSGSFPIAPGLLAVLVLAAAVGTTFGIVRLRSRGSHMTTAGA